MKTSRKNYKVDEVRHSLKKKRVITSNDIMKGSKVLRSGNFIEGVRHNPHLGNGSWGKIDYLTNYHNYVILS